MDVMDVIAVVVMGQTGSLFWVMAQQMYKAFSGVRTAPQLIMVTVLMGYVGALCLSWSVILSIRLLFVEHTVFLLGV